MPPPTPLRHRAEDHLSYIRDTMERASSFTAVPGRGGIVMGLAGLAAALIAPNQPTPAAWLATWLVAAVIATLAGLASVAMKARAAEVPLVSRPVRQFALGFAPAILAGALLTAALWSQGRIELLPGVWLLCYGAAVVSAGTFSIPLIPLMGSLFLFLGAVALFGPPLVGAIALGAGFGVLHIVFGAIIARRYGG